MSPKSDIPIMQPHNQNVCDYHIIINIPYNFGLNTPSFPSGRVFTLELKYF